MAPLDGDNKIEEVPPGTNPGSTGSGDDEPFDDWQSLKDAALWYAKHGYYIFPLRPGTKEPLTRDGFHSGTSKPAIVARWWDQTPDANIGWVPALSGQVLVDLDQKPASGDKPAADGFAELARIEASNETLPSTATIRTPNGGEHRIYSGSMPSSTGTIAPGIDIRGGTFDTGDLHVKSNGPHFENTWTKPLLQHGGYGLLPPSRISRKDGSRGAYEWTDTTQAATTRDVELPEWFQRLAPVPKSIYGGEAPEGFVPDTPSNEALAKERIARLVAAGEVSIEDVNGNRRLFCAAAWCKNSGVTRETAHRLLWEYFNPHCLPPWGSPDDETFCKPIDSAYSNPTIILGRDSGPDWNEHPWVKEQATCHDDTTRRSRFEGLWPDEYETLPPLEFWDDDKTLPKFPEGCIAILYGDWGSHKTNTAITMALDAIERGARVCYAAGEGAYGVGKDRIPAHCRARGIATKDLRGKLLIVPAVPLFASAEQVNEFCKAQQNFQPNIITLDTLATATAGEPENASETASFLTDNGPAGIIKRAFKALVLIPAHQGKDATKGVRGHSGFEANADVILHIEANKAGAIKVTVEKMRDGRDGFSIYFRVPPKGSPEVPVPVKITKADYDALAGMAAPVAAERQHENDQELWRLIAHLEVEKALDWKYGSDEPTCARWLAGPKPSPDDVEATRVWNTQVAEYRQLLRNKRRGKTWKAYCKQECQPGGTERVWRWFARANPETYVPDSWDTSDATDGDAR